jgi:hypothetical protein
MIIGYMRFKTTFIVIILLLILLTFSIEYFFLSRGEIEARDYGFRFYDGILHTCTFPGMIDDDMGMYLLSGNYILSDGDCPMRLTTKSIQPYGCDRDDLIYVLDTSGPNNLFHLVTMDLVYIAQLLNPRVVYKTSTKFRELIEIFAQPLVPPICSSKIIVKRKTFIINVSVRMNYSINPIFNKIRNQVLHYYNIDSSYVLGTRLWVMRDDIRNVVADNFNGYHVVRFDLLSIKEQIQLVRTHEFFISIHGAALTHLIFMSTTQTVVELFPPNNGTEDQLAVYYNLASISGINYHEYTCENMTRESISGFDLRNKGCVLDINKFNGWINSLSKHKQE